MSWYCDIVLFLLYITFFITIEMGIHKSIEKCLNFYFKVM